jgi:hypothetical protein
VLAFFFVEVYNKNVKKLTGLLTNLKNKMKSRYFNTKFWRDSYIDTLDPSEKFAFLHLLTNPETRICGVYELPQRIISSDTGFDSSMIEKIYKRFSRDGKMFYKDGWVCMVNAIKHQSLRSKSIRQGIKREIEEVPEEIMDYFYKKGGEKYITLVEEALRIEDDKKDKKIIIPEFVNKEAFNNFIEYRRERKKNLTQRSAGLIFTKLKGVSKKEQEIMINNSIERNWVGVFPLKKEKNTSGGFIKNASRYSDLARKEKKRQINIEELRERELNAKNNKKKREMYEKMKKLSNSKKI